jgi:phage terminase large subunit-like protein
VSNFSTACPDWETRIKARQPLITCEVRFEEEADAALEVFKSLRIVDAPNSPTFGEACDEWVFDFVRAIFGSYDPKSAKRLIREFFLLISKKNAKSTIAAGIMITALIRNWRHSCELLILAPTIEVANNSFLPARDMVRADPELLDLLHIQENQRIITHRLTKATLKVVAADSDTVSGKKAAFVLVDELWLFGKKPNADAMLREATGGLVSRPEGFVISLSTQSDQPPAGVFADKLRYARSVRDGMIEDPKFLPVIYEFPQAMIDAGEHLDSANFYITNPNIDHSVSKEWLEDETRKEIAKGPETRNVFLAKHLNVEIGLGLRTDSWAGAEFWAAAADKTLAFREVIKRSEVIVIGIDGGGLDDLLGLAVMGREKETGDWLLWSHAWAHEIVKERRKDIASKLDDLARLKQLTFVKLPGQDVYELADLVMEVEKSGKLAEEAAIGVDSFGVTDIVKELTSEERGIAEERIVGIPQGWQLNGAIKTAERNLAGGTLRHAGLDLMTWCVANAKVEPKGNAISITKQVSGSAKIDPLAAAFNTVVLMGKNPQPKQSKSYQMLVFG